MEGNFLSRYNTRINEWMAMIEADPSRRAEYESDMSEYIMQCMPYMKQYTEEVGTVEVTTDNVFNCKEIVGLQKRDIYVDYLIDVEKMNIDRYTEKTMDQCLTCPMSNIFQFSDTSELVCDRCGAVIAVLYNLSVRLTGGLQVGFANQ